MQRIQQWKLSDTCSNYRYYIQFRLEKKQQTFVVRLELTVAPYLQQDTDDHVTKIEKIIVINMYPLTVFTKQSSDLYINHVPNAGKV